MRVVANDALGALSISDRDKDGDVKRKNKAGRNDEEDEVQRQSPVLEIDANPAKRFA